jgi:NADPH-dependent curcumin reductase CurA
VTSTIISSEIRLVSHPIGLPTLDDFETAQSELPPPGDGQVLVRNLYMSVDPYMRARMHEGESYMPPFPIGVALTGGALGEVVQSNDRGLAPGDIVSSTYGWREYFVATAADVRRIDRPAQPVSAHLGVLGGTGFSAWVGLNIVDVKAGDRVFVSGAAGAVGSIAGQLARLRGCFVVGSAGSAAKAKMLVDELGFNAGINYRDGDLVGQLKAAAPEGIDVYFDNVGGDHLEAAIAVMRPHGRISACGAISTYNDERPSPGPRNLFQIVTKRLTIRGFLAGDSFDQLPTFIEEVKPLVAAGQITGKETIVEGIDRAPQAFIDMLRGVNVGKMLVKLA